MHNKLTKITVCICTYNRSKSLKITLENLIKLSVPDKLQWELIVVDNNSNDETKTVAFRLMDRLPLRYVFEANQGLSFARNKALEECKGNLLVFSDDDMDFSLNWLVAYWRAAQDYPSAEYFGGKIVPLWFDDSARWIRDINMALIAGLLGSYNLGEKIRVYNGNDMHPFGGNFALRRSMFEKLKPFRTDLGVCGNLPGRGEETEYFTRAQNKGFIGVYVADAVCYHIIDVTHLRLNYIYRYGVHKGIAEVRIHSDQGLRGSFLKELLFGLRGVLQLFKGRGDRFRQCVINMGIQAGLRRASMKKRSDHSKKCL